MAITAMVSVLSVPSQSAAARSEQQTCAVGSSLGSPGQCCAWGWLLQGGTVQVSLHGVRVAVLSRKLWLSLSLYPFRYCHSSKGLRLGVA